MARTRTVPSVTWTPPCVVLTLTGEVDIALSHPLARSVDQALRLLDEHRDPPPSVVVDLTAVSFLDSTGLHHLMRLRREAAERPRPVLVHLSIDPDQDGIRRLFSITALDTVFPIHATTAEAMAAPAT
ncbi:STAS domain-containing protein [Actinokineospora pegani]|uniref:STAS domain-containing protein n=1 Tax=Actinokineospora pegani TaxID=2654637 RepID=UPI0012EAFD7D|nr:STAS domain-containing protein [Actinokineospora pegani]